MKRNSADQGLAGVTLVEVLVSALLIFVGLGGIYTMYMQSLSALRKTRQYATATQVLQERVETLRSLPWPEISQGASLAMILRTPANSVRDLADADPAEAVVLSVPPTPGRAGSEAKIEVERRNGRTRVIEDADLSAERLLVAEVSIFWHSAQGIQQRRLCTVLGRKGLTRAGMFGSALGRPGFQGNVSP